MTPPSDLLDAQLLERLRHPDSGKWTTFAPDVLPLWVADMDFAPAPEIVEALKERLTRTVGYPPMEGDPELLDLIASGRAQPVQPGLTREDVWLLPSVVPGLYAGALALSAPGDEIITHVPIYPPFLGAAAAQGRVARLTPLVRDETGWQMDWDALEAAVSPATRMLMLCSPHNPTGRLWTRAELERLAEFALRHRLWVVTDELHANLTLEGEFAPFASLSPEIAARTVTLTGPCKTFNTAGLGIGAAISSNPELLSRLKTASAGLMAHPGALSMTMWRAGIEKGGPWLARTLADLRANRDLVCAYARERMPQVRFTSPQATYLAWLDFGALGWPEGAQAHLLEHAGVALVEGASFGPGFENSARLNFATPRPILQEALDRLARTVNSGG